ncbi:MAG: CDP-glucose 4,6-dehydratase [Fibrobacter sp.]|nr:CDP-glucose 4,6-dehydratase [Fibrobacter sp.]
MALFGGIYNKKRAFVTGHTGFKGSWLSFWLSKLGAEVTGYSLEPSCDPSHFGLLQIDINSTMGDICDSEKLQSAVKSAQPEIIFHLAAQPLVRVSYEDPVGTYRSNVMGTLQVCEAARRCPSVKAIVAITTDKVYQNREWEWSYREIDPLGGHDPYSSSKACAEILLASYRSSYFNPAEFGKTHDVLLTSVRAGNVIGGGDWSKDRLVPDMVKAAAAGVKTIIRNPHSTRPWQHVLECLSGYLCVGQQLLLRKQQFATAFNFGSAHNDALSVGKLVEMAAKEWPKIECEFLSNHKEPHEASRLHLDCSKAHSQLNWLPVWNVEQAMKKTISWYRDYYQFGKVNTGLDLDGYINDAAAKGAAWI